MNIFYGTYGLEFHNNQMFHHKVKAVFANQFASIIHRKLFLAFVTDAPMLQFNAKRIFVSGFKVTWTEATMNFNRRANNLPR